MIKASNISHFYGAEQVLFDLSFEVKSGEFLFLSGESGSGKFTLFSILSTLLKPSSGNFLIDTARIDEIPSLDSFRQNNVGLALAISAISVFAFIGCVFGTFWYIKYKPNPIKNFIQKNNIRHTAQELDVITDDD